MENEVVDMEKDPFKEYLRESEPDKAHKGYAWRTAIGLQAVDGLKPSKYLIDTAIQNIEGKITMKEAQNLIDSYYEERPVHLSDDERTEEADKVSLRIAEILSETAFSFSPNEYIAIHRKLFQGIYNHAGKIRDYNITKKEWVLDGATVMYGSASELRATLEYDFSQEKDFSYKGLSMDEIIHHLAVFISRLWQIHIFGEGNTRTTAVFFIKYLRTLLLFTGMSMKYVFIASIFADKRSTMASTRQPRSLIHISPENRISAIFLPRSERRIRGGITYSIILTFKMIG